MDQAQVEVAASAWRRFGKGRHPAALNFGGVFSYSLAAVRGDPLLLRGRESPATDVSQA